MTDQLADETAPAIPRRNGLRTRTVAIIALVCFLLGIGLTGYLGWRFESSMLTADEPETPAATEEEVVTDDGAAATAAKKSSEKAEVAQQAVQIVARQQGGLDQRVAALEQRIARLDLQAQAVEGNTARAEGLLIAFASRRAIEKGAPLGYLADQLKLRFGESKPKAVATIIDAANHPVTIDKLMGRLSALAPELESSPESGVFTRARNELSSLFVIRRESAPSPQPRKRLDRAKLYLESGRVDAAIAEVGNMPGAEGAKDWIADARRFSRAQEALDLLETAALLEGGGLRDGEGRKVVQPSPAANN